MRRWSTASLLVVASLYARVTGQWAITAGTAALLLAALAFGARLSLAKNPARVAAAIAGVAGGTLAWLAPPVPLAPLRAPWTIVALAGLFAGAAQLCSRESAQNKARATHVLPGLVALTACGEATIGWTYPILAVLHVALALLALRAGDRARPSLLAFPRRRLAAGALTAAVAALCTLAAARVLPPLSLWTEQRILHALGSAESGFSERMWLGSLDGMLQSDTVVMRVEGRADYLRGAVFDHYEIGRWGHVRTPAEAQRPTFVPVPSGPDPAGDRVRISLVSGARDRYFLPLGAHAVIAKDAGAAADRWGVVRVSDGYASAVSFAGEGKPDIAIADPTDADLAIPVGLRPILARIAAEWTAGATTPEAKVEAIAARLRNDYTYSLRYEHRRRHDPILDFLLDDHQGHCEYFATALTLLARAAGVPARVAMGYRVGEKSAIGDAWIVRERNAHAWSEVYLPGRGFVTMDATPAGAVPANEPHRGSYLAAAWEIVASSWSRLVARVTLVDVILALLALTVVGLVARRLMERRDPARSSSRRARVERPPPGLEKLLAALASRGAPRAASEPLERFASRLASGETAEAAALLERWAAHRYGGIGEGAPLLAEMERCANALEKTRRR